ncbi:hypothetical protein C8K36_1042 [Rhodococcus sp. OK519]|nr:hypothetical protein C8K36_1042 [Rhodococcus sp. OK519]
MVIVGTSAETAPTVPKDNETVGRRRIDVGVTTTAVSLRPVDRIVPAVRVVVQVSGAIVTIAVETVVTTAADIRVATTAAMIVAANVRPTIAVPSRGAATIVAPGVGRVVVAAKAASGRPVIVTRSGSSGVTPAPTSRISRTTSRHRSSSPPCAAIC